MGVSFGKGARIAADEIRERLQAWKEAGTKRHVDTVLIGAGQREALELPAETAL